MSDLTKMVEYSFPLRQGFPRAFLMLPDNLTKAEVARLKKMLNTLVVPDPGDNR